MSTVSKIHRLAFAIGLCALAVGCSTSPVDRENAYANDRVTTGSNIPKKGQAVVVNGDSVRDEVDRSPRSVIR